MGIRVLSTLITTGATESVINNINTTGLTITGGNVTAPSFIGNLTGTSTSSLNSTCLNGVASACYMRKDSPNIVTTYINVTDGQGLIAGTGCDFQMWHSGTNSYIANTTGCLVLQNCSGSNTYIYANPTDAAVEIISDGGVNLYHNDVRKLCTTSAGVCVVGEITTAGCVDVTAPNGSGQIKWAGSGSGLQGYTYSDTQGVGITDANPYQEMIYLYPALNRINFYTSGGTSRGHFDTNGLCVSNCIQGACLMVSSLLGLKASTLTYGTVETIGTKSGGWSGYLTDGLNFMSNGTYGGIFDDTNDKWLLEGYLNGAVSIYYNGISKLCTTSTGANISGDILFDGTSYGLKQSTGDYGTVETTGGKNTWGGFLTNGINFMGAGGSGGMYDDTNNRWMMCGAQGAGVELYYNGNTKICTTSTGIDITGRLITNVSGEQARFKYGSGQAGYITGEKNTANHWYMGAGGGGDAVHYYNYLNAPLELGTNSLPRLTIDGGGAVNVCSTLYAATCICSPVFYATTSFNTTGVGLRFCGGTGCGCAVDWIASSDCRQKKCIEPYNNGLEKINKLNPVYYNWIDEENKDKDMGFIAQEVLEIEPTLVSGSEETGYGLKYDKFSALVVKAMQELSSCIDELKLEINSLKNK